MTAHGAEAMCLRPMIVGFIALLGCILTPVVAQALTDQGGSRLALVVGINDYRGAIPDLEGAENDASGVAEVLVRNWGFAKEDVRLLLGADATRTATLDSIQSLISQSTSGSLVVIYFAGHGDSASGGYFSSSLPQGTGALVPADFEADDKAGTGLIVGRRDLRPLLTQLDAGGRQTLVIVDSCFSGNTVRGVGESSALVPRLPNRSAGIGVAAPELVRRGAEARYPYRNVIYLSAAAEYEPASDIPTKLIRYYPTFDGKPHGAFSDALLRALNGDLPGMHLERDKAVDFRALRDALAEFMQSRRYSHSPQMLPPLGSDPEVRLTPVKADARPAVVNVESELTVRSPVPNGLEGICRETVRCVPQGWDVALKADGRHVLLIRANGDILGYAGGSDVKSVGYRLELQRALQALETVIRGRDRSGLRIGFSDSLLGATRRAGDQFALRTQMGEGGRLVLIAADAEGALTVLYPAFPEEGRDFPAGVTHDIDGITVGPPFGMETVFAFLLPRDSAFPVEWIGGQLAPTREVQRPLLEWMTGMARGSSGAATLSVLTLP